MKKRKSKKPIAPKQLIVSMYPDGSLEIEPSYEEAQNNEAGVVYLYAFVKKQSISSQMIIKDVK